MKSIELREKRKKRREELEVVCRAFHFSIAKIVQCITIVIDVITCLYYYDYQISI